MRAGDGGECTTNTHRTATHASSPEEDNGDDLLVMVQKLAHGDTRGTAAERTLRLLRRAVVDASTRELTNRDDDEQETDNAADRTTAVFANVLSHYDGLGCYLRVREAVDADFLDRNRHGDRRRDPRRVGAGVQSRGGS